MNARPRLLVVPHVSAVDVAVREVELACRLTEHFDVYCLEWSDAVQVTHPSPLRRHWRQLRTALGAATARFRLSPGRGAVTFVRVPFVQPILLRRLAGNVRSLRWSQRINRRRLERVIREVRIGYVLLATDVFGLPSGTTANVFYDFADWYPEEQANAATLRWTRQRITDVACGAAATFAVSAPLREKLLKDFGIDATLLPNGADILALRAVTPQQISAVRQRWGLEGKYVIGYIGNHHASAGVDFAIEAFRELRRRLTDAALLVVGPAGAWRARLEAARPEGVVATGPILPAEVGAYFGALDVGVLAKPKTMETDLAFHLKVVEYTACRKFVVATPLLTWQRLAWPNVLLAERDPEAWAVAIVQARGSRWQPEWDDLVEPLDWRRLADRAARVMLGTET